MTPHTSLNLPDKVRDHAIARAAAQYGVRPYEITSRSRYRSVAHARQLAMWLLRQATRASGGTAYSFPEIGRSLGLDHTTVMHGYRAVEKRLADERQELAA